MVRNPIAIISMMTAVRCGEQDVVERSHVKERRRREGTVVVNADTEIGAIAKCVTQDEVFTV